jgi:very-short-patch-repair endonuclease
MGRRTEPGELPRVFRGSEAIRAGALTRDQLRGPAFTRLHYDVYTRASTPDTHELRCEGAALILPPAAAITGRSAATIRGVELARADDPVEVIAPAETRITRTSGVRLRRTPVLDDERRGWGRGSLATPLRMTLDLLVGRTLPDAVADLDALLRRGLVDLPAVEAMTATRSDRGIVTARRAVELADPRAESRPESRARVWLVLAGLNPQPQYWIEDSRGRLACVDLAFPAQRVAVEYDGSWRDGERWALNRDRERLNRVQAAGWEVVFVTAALLSDPDRLVRTVQAALARRV